jgi:hypothetical protein
MPTSHTELPTKGWCAHNFHLVRYLTPRACAFLVSLSACSSPEQRSQSAETSAAREVAKTQLTPASTLADSLAAICPVSGRRGSVQVARVDPAEAETGIAFKLLGDGAGPGVVLCRGVLYAKVDTLLELMGDTVTASESNGLAVLDSKVTQIPAYRHEGVLYVAVKPLAQHRRALFFPSREQPMDATVWPRESLLHLKSAGLTQGAAYQAAVREGLLPK